MNRTGSIALTLFLGICVSGQAQEEVPASVWRFSATGFGCVMNLAIREPVSADNSLASVELSFIYASSNPSRDFDIPLDQLRLSTNILAINPEDEPRLYFSMAGRELEVREKQFSRQLVVFGFSAAETGEVLEAMQDGSQIVIRLSLSDGEIRERTLHEANFSDEYKLLESCLDEKASGLSGN
jgi:hypothetical protein